MLLVVLFTALLAAAFGFVIGLLIGRSAPQSRHDGRLLGGGYQPASPPKTIPPPPVNP